MSKIINVGLIGFGMGGSVFHAPIITSLPEFKLVKIRESKNDRSSRFAIIQIACISVRS
jgi:predicted dehydrogenase